MKHMKRRNASAPTTLHRPRCFFLAIGIALCVALCAAISQADHLRQLQADAMANGHAAWGHWGPKMDKYNGWVQHTNRLIPVYTFGMNLDAFQGANSAYRDPKRIKELYGRLPEETLNPKAEYFDQTDVYRLQRAAAAAGKKHIIVVIFDGTDWQTTQAAAIYRSGKIAYTQGRGTGLSFLDYGGTTTDFGFFVSSPHNQGTLHDVDTQKVTNPGGRIRGGYVARLGGAYPWTPGDDPLYIIASRDTSIQHAYTDSAASATSMFSGIKTYNGAVNVDFKGHPVTPIARELQQQGFAIGVVTSVPVSHATPGCTYANNVHRYDYQDVSRDLLGQPSVAHPKTPLPGVDVLLGGGWGEDVSRDRRQGDNFVPGNQYLTDADLESSDVEHGGRYRVVQRSAQAEGRAALLATASLAAQNGQRLLGYFGGNHGHLPFRTADGGFNPVNGIRRMNENYTPADLRENPTLADMAEAALTVLETNPLGFWLMIEAGDVDWANHDNNIDASIGAVISGEAAFDVVIDWVEKHNAWDDTLVIVTADHGHYLVLEDPSVLIEPGE